MRSHLVQEAIFHFLFHWTTMTVHSNVSENLLLTFIRAMLSGKSVNKIQGALQLTGQTFLPKNGLLK